MNLLEDSFHSRSARTWATSLGARLRRLRTCKGCQSGKNVIWSVSTTASYSLESSSPCESRSDSADASWCKSSAYRCHRPDKVRSRRVMRVFVTTLSCDLDTFALDCCAAADRNFEHNPGATNNLDAELHAPKNPTPRLDASGAVHGKYFPSCTHPSR